MTWRVVSPTAVRGVQLVLLLFSMTYGITFIAPVGLVRSPIYEYISTPHTPVWLWGGTILSACALGLIAEVFFRDHARVLAWAPLTAHALLAAVFFAVGCAALWYSIDVQTSGRAGPWSTAEFIGAINRPAQYWFLAYMNAIFARRIDVTKHVLKAKAKAEDDESGEVGVVRYEQP